MEKIVIAKGYENMFRKMKMVWLSTALYLALWWLEASAVEMKNEDQVVNAMEVVKPSIGVDTVGMADVVEFDLGKGWKQWLIFVICFLGWGLLNKGWEEREKIKEIIKNLKKYNLAHINKDKRIIELKEFIEKNNKVSGVEIQRELLLSIYSIMQDLDNTYKEVEQLWESHDDLVWLLFKSGPRKDYEKRFVYLQCGRKPELTCKFWEIMEDNFGIGFDNEDFKKMFDKWFKDFSDEKSEDDESEADKR